MSSERDTRFWINAWWPVLLAAIIVALTSNAHFGADRTSALLLTIWKRFFPPISHAQWYWIIFSLRTTCHFIAYGIIGLAWLRAWRLIFPRAKFLSDMLLTVTGVGLIACCDEFHQTLIPNRTGSLRDVLIDCCGAALICVLALRNRRRFEFQGGPQAAEQLRATGDPLSS